MWIILQFTLQRLQHGALAHCDSHFSLQVTGLLHDPTNHRTRVRIQLYDWSASHKFMKINIQLTLQRLQHGPLAHWDSRFSLQVTGSQHGSTISQFSGLPQSQASPSSTIPLPHDPKSGIWFGLFNKQRARPSPIHWLNCCIEQVLNL